MKSLYESILSSTNAGKISLVKAWLEYYGIKNYTINTNGEIDINGDVKLSYKNIKEFPHFIQFGTVKGNFDCKHNNLISLKGGPREVKGNFDCACNVLTSLEGAPEKVEGSFDCSHNGLTSLKGGPREVKGNFDCTSNNIEDLKGAPRKAKVFTCDQNTTKFTEEDVRKVCKVEKKIYV